MGFGANCLQTEMIASRITVRKKQGCHGFTLMELAVAIAIIGILVSVLLSGILFYQESAERVAVEQTLSTLRSALHLQIANLLVKNNTAAIDQLVKQNPMDWLVEKPGNYVGEYYAPQSGAVPSGNWYFDLHDKTLVYVVNNHQHLRITAAEDNKLRFHLKSLGDPRPVFNSESNLYNAGASDKAIDAIDDIVLQPVISYSWF